MESFRESVWYHTEAAEAVHVPPPMKLSTALPLLVSTRAGTPDEPTPRVNGEGRALPGAETRSRRHGPEA
jgi:hypothetical protein